MENTIKTIPQSKVFFLATIIALGGCANTPPVSTVKTTSSTMYFPEIGVTATADVGQGILSKANVFRTPGMALTTTISEVVNPPGTTTIYAGSLPLHTTNNLGSYYKDPNATYTMLGQAVPSSDRSGIFVPNDQSKPSVIYHYTTSYNYGEKPISSLKPITIETWGENSFKQELIYLGVQQNTITILYREFKDSIARPAFSQEIKYDLSQGREIGYKGARFEILKASNTELTYKVLRPLD